MTEEKSPSVSQAANDLRTAAGEKAKEFAHHSIDQARDATERAANSAQSLRTAAQEKTQALREAATDRAQQFRRVADEQWSQTCEQAKEFQGTAEDYVRKNPTTCVLGALGIGFLLGLISRR